MNPVLFIIAILWIAAGTALIIYTGGMRTIWGRIARFNHRWLAVLPAMVGVILVVSGFYYPQMLWLAVILGILALLKASLLTFGPSRWVQPFLDWWVHKAGDGTLRLFGLIAFILGSVLLSYIL
jgi:hypothetical protein